MGELYIYLSNENETPVEVFFDDFRVEHVKSAVVQMDDYYPFGLSYNSYSRENLVKQNYKFNGIEEQDGLGLSLYSAVYRTFDPAIGRWWSIDPKLGFDVSPYAGMRNNPAIYSDQLGDTTQYYNMATGALLGTINNAGAVARVKVQSSLYTNAMEAATTNEVDLNDQSSANTFVSNFNGAASTLENSMSDFFGRAINLIAYETGQSLIFTGMQTPIILRKLMVN